MYVCMYVSMYVLRQEQVVGRGRRAVLDAVPGTAGSAREVGGMVKVQTIQIP